MNIVRIVLSVLLGALLLATGGGKLAGAASSHAIRDGLGVSAARWKAIGAVEMVLVAGLAAGVVVRPVALFAALGVIGLMVGAIVVRRSAGGAEQTKGIVVDVVVLVITAVAGVLSVTA